MLLARETVGPEGNVENVPKAVKVMDTVRKGDADLTLEGEVVVVEVGDRDAEIVSVVIMLLVAMEEKEADLEVEND